MQDDEDEWNYNPKTVAEDENGRQGKAILSFARPVDSLVAEKRELENPHTMKVGQRKINFVRRKGKPTPKKSYLMPKGASEG